MVHCEICGREFVLGHAPIAGSTMICTPCVCRLERRHRRAQRMRRRVTAIVWISVAFAWIAVLLWSEWKRTEYVPGPRSPIPAEPPQEILPEPGGDGAVPQELPLPAAVRSLDF